MTAYLLNIIPSPTIIYDIHFSISFKNLLLTHISHDRSSSRYPLIFEYYLRHTFLRLFQKPTSYSYLSVYSPYLTTPHIFVSFSKTHFSFKIPNIIHTMGLTQQPSGPTRHRVPPGIHTSIYSTCKIHTNN